MVHIRFKKDKIPDRKEMQKRMGKWMKLEAGKEKRLRRVRRRRGKGSQKPVSELRFIIWF